MSKIMNKDYMKNVNKFAQMLNLLNAEYKKYSKLFKKGYVCEKNFKIDHFEHDSVEYLLTTNFEYSSIVMKLKNMDGETLIRIKTFDRMDFGQRDKWVDFTIKTSIKNLYNIPSSQYVDSLIVKKAFGIKGYLDYYRINYTNKNII